MQRGWTRCSSSARPYTRFCQRLSMSSSVKDVVVDAGGSETLGHPLFVLLHSSDLPCETPSVWRREAQILTLRRRHIAATSRVAPHPNFSDVAVRVCGIVAALILGHRQKAAGDDAGWVAAEGGRDLGLVLRPVFWRSVPGSQAVSATPLVCSAVIAWYKTHTLSHSFIGWEEEWSGRGGGCPTAQFNLTLIL